MTTYSHFAQKPVDKRSRKAMALYLLKHPRYGLDFCQNVKLRNLIIPRDQIDSAYALLEQEEPFNDIRILMDRFSADQGGVEVGQEGRSGGYLVLYADESDDLPRDNSRYDSFTMGDLRWLCRLVEAFDGLCDDCVAEFMFYVTDYHVETENVSVEEQVQFLVAND